MGGTKIVVFQLKDIIKAALIALGAIVLVILLIVLFMPKGSSDDSTAQYVPGTYTSQLSLRNEPVGIEVRVSKDGISSISLKGMNDKSAAFYPLLQPALDNMSKEIIAAQNLNISVSGKNPVTDQILLDGIKSALAQAQVKN